MVDVGDRSAFSTFIGHVSVSEAGAKSAASCVCECTDNDVVHPQSTLAISSTQLTVWCIWSVKIQVQLLAKRFLLGNRE